MTSWSKRRKFIYAALLILILAAAIGLPSFFFFYKTPTCFDGIKNGNEQDIDCGGKCSRLCQSSFLPASVSWTRLEKVTSNLYNAAAYIVNPNTEGEAKNVPFHMALYDKSGLMIVDKEGFVTLPPHRNILAFLGAVDVGSRTPTRVLFEFTSAPDWYKKTDSLSAISIESKDYSEDSSGSLLQVKLKNNDVRAIGKISVYAILYDRDGAVIGFSKTNVDGIDPQATVIAPFTWNINRNNEVISIEVLYMAE